ncbi:hypothetical protein [Rickettsia montanensis]|uniref:hypothetical protein n=1 Tax=Rickettsia montanensis TaxID=33991 RepID=UPI0012EA70B1|nr:hypothetical protein [Rickettsia montanensis]
MPDINFDIEVKGKKYNFSKLPADDMRGFMLGEFSNSCQSIGHDSTIEELKTDSKLLQQIIISKQINRDLTVT